MLSGIVVPKKGELGHFSCEREEGEIREQK